MNEILFEEYQFQAVLRVNGELKFLLKLSYVNMNMNRVKKHLRSKNIGWYSFWFEGNKTWNLKTRWTLRDYLVRLLSLYLFTDMIFLPNEVTSHISNLWKIIVSELVVFSVTDVSAIVIIIVWNNVNSSGCQYEGK